MTPDAVIFDIGNVLIEWAPERYYDRVYGVDRRKALFAEVDLDGMNTSVDLGAPFRDLVYETAEAHPTWRAEIRDWHDNWIELAKPAIEHSVTLMRRLRSKGVAVHCLTNFGVESYAYAQTQYDFLNEFDVEFVSGRLKVIKPDPRIYEIVEEDLGVAPDAILFTDDREDNVATARARGWQAHHFDGPSGWAARLVAAGLLTEEEAKP
ncbi:Hydrolase [Roseibacterium elongatum DSM 19469]|uniref:Hydrolase n=1 Tax=Roseicyclus elongatus DSM 19469 TaxID=1294273 RepID=W8SLX1_9RHOB|nr:HAD family phosphatase [Roseibacterium elongatum]AHM03530.1 Hydrolase [Roseibacterium elongatum DSM 19469]